MPAEITSRKLADILAGTQLPALPQSAIRLLELSQNPDNGPAEFAAPIEADPGLTGQVLRFVNSSYFGFAREISSVKLAITLVGIRTIKNFALWSAVFSLMPNPKCGPFDLKCLWQDSLRRALFARIFGKVLGLKDAEDLFAAALLQDMAIPILAKELSTEYAKLLSERERGRVRLSQLEKRAFGWTHAEASGWLARSWSLPESFATLMETHTELATAMAAAKALPGPLAVGLSSMLPAASDPMWVDRAEFESIYNKLCGANGVKLGEMLSQVDQGFADFAPLLKIATPAKSLIQYYQEATAMLAAAK